MHALETAQRADALCRSVRRLKFEIGQTDAEYAATFNLALASQLTTVPSPDVLREHRAKRDTRTGEDRAKRERVTSTEHVTIDETLIEARA